MDINNGTEFGTVKIITLKGEKGDAGQNGTSGDYSALSNKPSIGGVTLSGNKTASDLGLATSSTLASLANRIGDLETKLTLQKSDAIYPSNSVTIPSGQSGVVQFFVPPTVCDIAEYICLASHAGFDGGIIISYVYFPATVNNVLGFKVQFDVYNPTSSAISITPSSYATISILHLKAVS